jgi:predicted transcriptional regulator YdeE
MKSHRPGIPSLIERYNESFKHKTGEGEVEVWVPVAS